MKKLLKVKKRVFLPEIAARSKLFPRPTHGTEGMRQKWYTEKEAARIVALLLEAKGDK